VAVAARTPGLTVSLSAIEVLERHLGDTASSFMIGVPAAVAEFMRDPEEPAGADGLAVTTPRGGLRVTWRDDARPVAYEALSRRPERWLHGVVFCLPEAAARMGAREALTELGPDREALHAGDRDAVLFDLGVGAPQIDFCVRTSDPGLTALLRRYCGRAMTDWPGELAAALLEAGPQRVVASRLGRIEVTQPIPRKRTPLGPHTHLFPDRIGEGRRSGEGVPLPEGWLPCLHLFPPHPCLDLAGDERPFEDARHAAFQRLLEAWGPADYVIAKARVHTALESGAPPEAFEPEDSLLAHLALRVALRQLRQTQGDDEVLAAWCAQFDPSPR
jgi:hypothetical protein